MFRNETVWFNWKEVPAKENKTNITLEKDLLSSSYLVEDSNQLYLSENYVKFFD